ncbi:hypothetical protein ANTRET_LOCUS1027 [Anthophora retusa]
MIVPLLISVEASSEKLSFAPAEEKKAIVAPLHRQSDVKQVHDENTNLMQKRQSNKNERFSNEQDLKTPHDGTNSMENRFVRSNGKGLAHKMAKDALKSPKMQETMRKLSKVSKPKSTVKLTKSRLRMSNERRHQNSARHKGGRKRKRKRHHRRHEKDHSRLLKGGSSKRTLNRKRDISSSSTRSLDNLDEDTLDDELRDESSSSRSKDKVTVVKVEDSEYIDFSTPVITESSLFNVEPRNTDDTVKSYESEKMIDRLMKTTTKDPSKRNPGDQGIEYSDYYSDDEILQDLAANKIPVQVANLNSNDRFAREALNFTPYRDRNRRRIDKMLRDRIKHKKEMKYRDTSVDSLNNLPNYPEIERTPLSRRNIMLDDSSSNYPSSYESFEHRRENIDSPYSDNNEFLEQSRGIDESTDLQSNAFDVNKLNIEAQYPERFNYMNQYRTPEETLVPSNELQSLNTNEPIASQLPSIRDLNNYQEDGSFNQPQMENPRIPSVNVEDIETQPSYSPLQLYNKQEEQQPEQSVQPEYDPSGLPNAMDQPLGKILESLGINVNGASSNFNPYQVSSYTNTMDRPVERMLSPSYLRKRPNEDFNSYHEGNNVKELDFETSRSRNREKEREGHFRRHLIENGEFDRNTFDDEKPTHMNISIAVHDTKEVANQILDTIMEELEELKTDRSQNNKREGLPCRLSGSWSTAQAGVKLDMRVVNRTIIVTLSDLTPPRYHESLLNGTWNVSGNVPFKRGSPFTLIATDSASNSLAVFVGTCRVCQGVDTIAGVWSVARQPKGCNDFQVATTVFNDIFRKTKLSSLKENQGTNRTESATLNHKKRKS